MRIGLSGGSYTDTSLACEETINLYRTSVESQGAVTPKRAYGGSAAEGTGGLKGAPGLELAVTLPNGTPRGQIWTGSRWFAVGGDTLYEISTDGGYTLTVRGTAGVLDNDNNVVSMAFSSIQLMIVSFGHLWCYDLAADTLTDVTSQLAGTPGVVEYISSYFVVNLLGTDKFQFSDILDGSNWPGLNVNGVSQYAENISTIKENHNELWVFGLLHCVVYQVTSNDDVFEPNPGAKIETGSITLWNACRLDNSLFWINQDERGGRMAVRSSSYTPMRISTHAVEIDWAQYTNAQIQNLTTYALQIDGHNWWVVYIPGASWTWVYDVNEGLWFKLANWDSDNGPFSPHRSWNHVYVNGQHFVGDWNSSNIYEMHPIVDNGDGTYSFATYNGGAIRRLRRFPTYQDERQYLPHALLEFDMATGLGPQPPLKDGDGNDRQPQCMLRWSDDTAFKLWSNIRHLDCGFAGQYNTRVRSYRMGRARKRVYEWAQTDPIPTWLRDAYLNPPQ